MQNHTVFSIFVDVYTTAPLLQNECEYVKIARS